VRGVRSEFSACLSEFIRYNQRRNSLAFRHGPCQEFAMPRRSSSQPTEVEMQILRILWSLGPSPVREIHRRLKMAKGTSYSTTVKMLAIMLEKGLVTRDEEAQPHIYKAALTRDAAGKRLVRDLIDKVYNGSAHSLVLQALATQRATREERDEIRRLLDRMEGRS
jgi:BlaI family penicillinase repressor